MTSAAVRESVAWYAVRRETPLGSAVAGAGVAPGVRMRCKAPTSAQVTVTNRDPEDAEMEGSDEGVAAEAGASAAAGVGANSEELTSDEVTASAPQTAAVSSERRGTRAIRFGNRPARLGDFLRRGAGLCLLPSITIWWVLPHNFTDVRD